MLVPVLGHQARLWNLISKLKDGSVYQCFRCSSNFNRLLDLSDHLKEFHKLQENSVHKCPHCGSLYQRKSYLQHFRNVFKLHKQLLKCNSEAQEIQNGVDEIDLIGLDFGSAPVPDKIEILNVDDHVLKLFASLLKSGKVPMSTSNQIMSDVKTLMSIVVRSCKEFSIKVIQSSLEKDGKLRKLNQLDSYLTVFDKLNSKYKLDKYFLEQGFMIPAKEIVLDTDLGFSRSKDGYRRQRYRPITVQYVPIRSSIAQLLAKPGFYSLLQNRKHHNGEYYTHFREGSYCNSMAINLRDTIFISIYYDDAEVANPLGSKKGKHKLANFYFSIIDLPAHMLSSIDNTVLLASLKSEDLKFCTANSVMQIVVDELQDLRQNGINIVHNGEQISLKVILAQVCGDNLGLHSILGFSEGFTANFPCRMCKMHRNECQLATTENQEKLRSVINYRNDLIVNNFSATGLNFESVLNELPYFHVTNNFVFDIMHDVLEGVGPDLILCVLNSFLTRKIIKLDKLNYRIDSFDFGRHYLKSKPSEIKSNYLKGETLTGQNASQSLCLLLFLPVLIGDFVPHSDKVWQVYLLFVEVLNIILSHEISQGGCEYLNSITQEFLMQYQIVFSKTLKPKHHHLTHYVSSIFAIGPLRSFWSMTFEARHKFFKTTAHSSCNFRNIPKSLAYRFQLARCFRLLEEDTFTPNRFEYLKSEFVNVDDISHADLVKEKLTINTELEITSKVTINGGEFRIGCFILLEYCSQFPVFGRVEMIILENSDCNFVVKIVEAEYIEHYACFVLIHKNKRQVVNLQELKYYQPLYPSKLFANNDPKDYIVFPLKFL